MYNRKAISTGFIVAIIVVVVFIAAVSIYFALQQGQQGATTTSPVPKSVTVVLPQGVASDTKLNFNPANITVVIGVNNTILWVDQDSRGNHTVTAISVPQGAQKFDSSPNGNLRQGDNFSVTLTVPGVYRYHCIYHSWMVGTIVVKSP